MKQAIILLSSLFLVQGLSLDKATFTNTLDQDFEEVFAPLFKEYVEMQNVIQEATRYQASQESASNVLAERLSNAPADCLQDLPLTQAWNKGDCQNLTKDVKEAVVLVRSATQWAYHAGVQFFKKVLHLLRCSVQMGDKAFECVKHDVDDLKQLMKDLKPQALKYREDFVQLGKELRESLRQCVRMRLVHHATVQQALIQAELCASTLTQ